MSVWETQRTGTQRKSASRLLLVSKNSIQTLADLLRDFFQTLVITPITLVFTNKTIVKLSSMV